MSDLHVISYENHGNKYWQRYSSYAFAAGDAIAQLVMQEIPKAAMVIPVGFIQTDNGFLPVAVQGLQPGQNLFVAPDGRWLGQYIPAAYRGYPFTLANTDDGQQVLCMLPNSELLSDTDGELFFDDEKQPAPALKDVLNFLTNVSQNRQLTKGLCDALAQHDLFQPWPITLQTDGGQQTIEGLYRIDEAALNQLPAAAFEQLRQAGALPLAYCQLLSMQHLQKLGQLAQAHADHNTALAPTASGELDLEFLNDGGSISFSGLS